MRLKVLLLLLVVLFLAFFVTGAPRADGVTTPCISHEAVIANIKAESSTAALTMVEGKEAARLVRKMNAELVWGEIVPFVGSNAIISLPSAADGLARVDLFDGRCATKTIFAPPQWFERWIGRGA